LRELHRDPERSWLYLVVVDADGHEPDALCFFTREHVARQEVVLRFRHAAQQRPTDRGVVTGGDAEAGVAIDDPCRATDHGDVRKETGGQTRADRGTVHGRHDRLRAVDHVEDEVTRFSHDARSGLVAPDSVADQVEGSARREGFPGAAQERHAHVGITVDREPNVGQLTMDLRIHGVETRRVHRDPQHAVVGSVGREPGKGVVRITHEDAPIWSCVQSSTQSM
jgi:hypothetical protein